MIPSVGTLIIPSGNSLATTSGDRDSTPERNQHMVKMNAPRCTALIGLAILIGVSMSCSTAPGTSWKSDYVMAMDAVRASVRAKGIPREKVYYQFQLYGMSSKRMEAGGRGGYTSVWEEWELRDGFHLAGIKYSYYGNIKVTPNKAGDSYFAPGSRLMAKEKFYHELRLEPYFDTIRLTDRTGQLVAGIELPRESSGE